MFAIFLQEVVAKVAHLTAKAFVLTGIDSGEYRGKRRVIAEQASFRGHHKLFSTTVFNEIHRKR